MKRLVCLDNARFVSVSSGSIFVFFGRPGDPKDVQSIFEQLLF